MNSDTYSVAFIIAHRYYRNYPSFIKYYVDNIQRFYKNSFILIVDNNSENISDIVEVLKDYKNLVILTNNTPCKFEIGAYKVGIQYLLTSMADIIFDYCVFTQDNYILKQKYDFNNLITEGINATSFVGFTGHKHEYYYPFTQDILKRVGLENDIDKLTLCWCSSFILHYSKIFEFLKITQDIVITTRRGSCEGERFLSAIIYKLNDYKMVHIEGDMDHQHYNCHKVDLIKDVIPEHCFVKCIQGKTELTKEN